MDPVSVTRKMRCSPRSGGAPRKFTADVKYRWRPSRVVESSENWARAIAADSQMRTTIRLMPGLYRTRTLNRIISSEMTALVPPLRPKQGDTAGACELHSIDTQEVGLVSFRHF